MKGWVQRLIFNEIPASLTCSPPSQIDASQDILTAPTTERTADQPSKDRLDDSQPEEEEAKQSEGETSLTFITSYIVCMVRVCFYKRAMLDITTLIQEFMETRLIRRNLNTILKTER